jgi:hypothetical protein
MARPIDNFTSAELFALAAKLDEQGLFAAIDIQESSDKKDDKTASNGSKLATLNSVVADSVRYVAEMRRLVYYRVENLPANTMPQAGME